MGRKPVICLSLLLVLMGACKKYDEGPGISLRSKKARVSNTWKIQNYLENGVDKTTDYTAVYQNARFSIMKTEKFIFTYTFNGSFDVEQSGNWHFNSNKTKLLFTQLSPTTDSWAVDILRLKETELWLTESDSGMVKEYRLIPQ